MKLYYVIIFTMIFGAGCTIVEVHGNAQVERSGYWGIAPINIAPKGNITLTKTTGYGVVTGISNFYIGYAREQSISVLEPEKCSAIIVVDTDEQLVNLIDKLTKLDIDVTKLCVNSVMGAK